MSTSRQHMGKFSAGLRLPLARAHASNLMPYFTTGIQQLVPVPTPGKGTFGVTEFGHLLYDPAILAELYVDEAGTLILHEFLHIYFNHTARFKDLIRRGVLDAGDGPLFNRAADCEINDNLEAAGCVFPRPEVMGAGPTTAESLGLPAHRTAEEYAVALKKKQEQNPGQPQAGPGWGACGSGAGNPLPDEPGNDPQGDPNNPDPSNPPGRDETELEMSRQDSAKEAAKASRGQGNVPKGIALHADALVKPPKVDWRALLAAQVQAAVTHKAGSADYTYTRRSHFQGMMEMMHGEEAPIIPGMWAPVVKVALVIDTSGSMAGHYDGILSEAAAILKALNNATLSVVACDAEVQAVAEVSDIKEIAANLKGGGGTDFRPAFDHLQSKRPKQQPDIVVFATDGYGAYPDTKPAWNHIWLNVDGRIGVDWGTEVTLDHEDCA